jgi:hypothetical protein
MANKTHGKAGGGKSNEMEERDSTPEEVAQIAATVGLTDHLADPLPPYRGDREDDEPDREGPPAHVIEAQRAAEAARATMGGVTSDELNARMLKAIESMEKRIAEGNGTAGQEMMALAMMQLAEGLKAMRQGQIDGANIIANMQRSTTSPENKFFPAISVYNPRGDKDFPRPPLRCKYALPWPVEPSAAEELTAEEIELLNLLVTGEHLVIRADRTRIKVICRIHTKLDSDEPSLVVLNHETAFNNDYQRLMPYDWIRQMLESNPKTRAAAKMVLTMEEREALILARKFDDGTLAAPDQQVVSVGA